MYGYDFLFETYLYHFSRRDNRISYSPYFYDLYLNYENDTLSPSISRNIVRVIPSLYAIYFLCVKCTRRYPIFMVHLILLAFFVTLNKVCTLQYYEWIAASFYLIYPATEMFKKGKYYKFLMICCIISFGPIWLQLFDGFFLNDN
jgi:phosphatidylinositol glycan class M